MSQLDITVGADGVVHVADRKGRQLSPDTPITITYRDLARVAFNAVQQYYDSTVSRRRVDRDQDGLISAIVYDRTLDIAAVGPREPKGASAAVGDKRIGFERKPRALL
jgi:hypothetical protein